MSDKPTGLQWFATARNYGWAPCDEDSPQEFCRTEQVELHEVLTVDVEHWRDEYKWWKQRP